MRTRDGDLTYERLREVLHYEPQSGRWTRRLTLSSNARAGDEPGDIEPTGYRRIMIDGRRYKSARLAFLYMTGAWPPALMDHRDGDRGNDRWVNLRPANYLQNNSNRQRRRDNQTGFTGVVALRSGSFAAQINVAGKRHYLGTFTALREASEAYRKAADKYYGPFARAVA